MNIKGSLRLLTLANFIVLRIILSLKKSKEDGTPFLSYFFNLQDVLWSMLIVVPIQIVTFILFAIFMFVLVRVRRDKKTIPILSAILSFYVGNTGIYLWLISEVNKGR
jgi:hypothetical protein